MLPRVGETPVAGFKNNQPHGIPPFIGFGAKYDAIGMVARGLGCERAYRYDVIAGGQDAKEGRRS
jgi:hypothetical protein